MIDDTEIPPTKKTIESWAVEKGLCSSMRIVHAKQPATLMQVPDWRCAATKACSRWPTGLEVTELEFDEAVQRALSIAVK